MSHTPIKPPTQDDIAQPDKASSYAINVLTMDEKTAQNVIGDTTITAYRRIHEIVTSALDEVERGRDIHEAVLSLTKSLILMKYQVARHIVSFHLVKYIEPVISNILNCVKESKDLGKCRDRARYGRLILDALAVLVYRYGKK
jgi:CRISPR/Cas system CSM-associated protein Csm2 small subunit